MIKEIKTEKFEGVAVLVPDGTTDHELKYIKYSDGKEYHGINYKYDRSSSYTHGGFLLWYKDFGGRKNYPKEGELQLLGKSTDLTEEQCSDIMSSEKVIVQGVWPIVTFSGFETAKESFASLMQSIGATQGTWIILKKI